MPNDRDTTTAPQNSGHGHVRPRPDGVKMRCGGPGLCQTCAQEAAALAAAPSPVPAQEPVAWRITPSASWGGPLLTAWPEQVDNARIMGCAITPLYAAPVGQAEDAARWQPIETVPANESVLVYRAASGRCIAMHVVSEPQYGERAISSWKVQGQGYLHSYSTQPTHWMPLPPPPSAQQAVQPQPGEQR